MGLCRSLTQLQFRASVLTLHHPLRNPPTVPAIPCQDARGGIAPFTHGAAILRGAPDPSVRQGVTKCLPSHLLYVYICVISFSQALFLILASLEQSVGVFVFAPSVG